MPEPLTALRGPQARVCRRKPSPSEHPPQASHSVEGAPPPPRVDRRTSPGLAELLPPVPENGPSDDQVLDLPRTLVDVGDANVPEPLLEEVLA